MFAPFDSIPSERLAHFVSEVACSNTTVSTEKGKQVAVHSSNARSIGKAPPHSLKPLGELLGTTQFDRVSTG